MSTDPLDPRPGSDGADPQADRWLDVLAGRAEPADADTRQAARARGLFVAQVEAESRRPGRDAAKAQRLKVLLNVMQAEGEAAARAAQAGKTAGAAAGRPAGPAAGGYSPPGPVTRLLRWLFPPAAPAATWRLGSVAMGLLGLTVAVRVLMPGAGDDDATGMKSAPPAASAAPGAAVPPGTVPLVLTAAEPLQDALALQTALARVGVQAEVYPLGASARLEAPVPAAQGPAVQAALARRGLAWEPAPGLVVEFKAP